MSPRLRPSRRAALALGGGALFTLLGARGSGAATPERLPVETEVRVLPGFAIASPSERRFGRLTDLGGLEVSSSWNRFGGYSGLVTFDRGRRFVTVSDTGHFLSGRFTTGPDGRLLGLAEVTRHEMVVGEADASVSKSAGDAEALALRDGAAGPEILVAFERRHRVVAFPLGADGAPGVGRAISMPAAIRDLRSNKGLEGLAVAPKASPLAGAIVAAAERARDGEADMPGFIVGGPRPGTFTVARHDDFDLTDLAFLPSGDLLVLERRFNWSQGVAMRLRLVPAAKLVPGARLDGDLLLDWGMAYQIDNMEGLAVDLSPSGDTIVTIVSDDNVSILQRTLFLRFLFRDE